MAHAKFWEKEGDRLTPPLGIFLLFEAAAVSGDHGNKRSTQSTLYYGTVYCAHDANLNIASRQTGGISCIKPVH